MFNFPESWKILLDYDVITAVPSKHFLTNNRVPSIVYFPVPLGALQQIGTSDMNLKTAQVTSNLDNLIHNKKRTFLTTSHACNNSYQHYQSCENPYVVLQVTYAASKCAMKSKIL